MKGSRYKVDLHTHSIISQDGGITASQYEKVLQSSDLDCIAITDHNETGFARVMHKKFGDKIIVGEEISTREGEIIGLFLNETIPGGLTVDEAIASIRHQGGLVYIPHPFEIFRRGLAKSVVERITKDIDIIEVFNGRGRFRGKQARALKFALTNNIPEAASSDAHSVSGLGFTASMLSGFPTEKNLKQLLDNAIFDKTYAPFYTFFYPMINKIRNNIVLLGER
jgi:predicted metal-dependent phosphoesterase TrpH